MSKIPRTRDRDEVQYVPKSPPHGNITDGDWICGRCGEEITGCALCAGEIRHVIRANNTDRAWRY